MKREQIVGKVLLNFSGNLRNVEVLFFFLLSYPKQICFIIKKL